MQITKNFLIRNFLSFLTFANISFAFYSILSAGLCSKVLHIVIFLIISNIDRVKTFDNSFLILKQNKTV
jgi:hypothetical protein